MAAGTTIKLKRKAGAFVTTNLAAGEPGVDTTNAEFYFSTDGTDVVKVGGGEATISNESETAHGFTVGELVYDNAGTWAKGKADDEATAEVIGIVTVSNTNDFDMVTGGYCSGLSGLTANTLYFLSATTAGAMTATEPTNTGYVSKPVFWATSTTTGYFLNYRGMVIGGVASGDMVKLATATASGDATVEFTSLETGTYKYHQLKFAGVIPVTDSTELQLQFRIGGTWQTTASTYNSGYSLQRTESAADLGGYWSTASYFNLVDLSGLGNSTNEMANGTVDFFNLGATSTKLITFHNQILANNALSYSMNGGGEFFGSTSAVDGIRILISSGNVSVGEFDLYGYK